MTEEEIKYLLSTYDITEDGSVYLKSNNRLLKFYSDREGYLRTTLTIDVNGKRKRKNCSLHRILAIKFIPNPNNYPVVNHIDGNKKNNKLNNLEWCTVSRNTQHGYDNCCYSNVKKVKVTEPNGDVKVFPSISHASRYYGYKNSTTIAGVLRGRRNRNNPIPRGPRKGLFFEFTDEGVTTIEKVTDTAISE